MVGRCENKWLVSGCSSGGRSESGVSWELGGREGECQGAERASYPELSFSSILKRVGQHKVLYLTAACNRPTTNGWSALFHREHLPTGEIQWTGAKYNIYSFCLLRNKGRSSLMRSHVLCRVCICIIQHLILFLLIYLFLDFSSFKKFMVIFPSY